MPNTKKSKKKLSEVSKKAPKSTNGKRVKSKDGFVQDKSIEILDWNNKAKDGELHFRIRYKEITVDIKKTGGWWSKLGKLSDFCGALKMGCEILEACAYAGISYEQWRYFKNEHPEFSQLKDVLQEWATMRVRYTALNGAIADPRAAMEWLQITKPKQFNKRVNIDHSGVIKHQNLSEDNDPEAHEIAKNAASNVLDILPDSAFEDDEEKE